jgi:two-component system, cell cycle response regulator DivK
LWKTDDLPDTGLISHSYVFCLKNSNLITNIDGYTVFISRLGKSTLELARQYRSDLILMDIQLPDIAGMEATRRLKADEQTRTIPVIACYGVCHVRRRGKNPRQRM